MITNDNEKYYYLLPENPLENLSSGYSGMLFDFTIAILCSEPSAKS